VVPKRKSSAARLDLGRRAVLKPGITGSSFAPGASSRPIIRGLDVNRVGIVDNGIGGGGVSDEPLRPGQPAGNGPDRGDPRAGHVALRLAIDRRRGQLDQQPNSDALPCGPFGPLRPPGIYKAPPAGWINALHQRRGRGAVSSAQRPRRRPAVRHRRWLAFGDIRPQDGEYRVPSYPI
jgi:hypothetical protein